MSVMLNNEQLAVDFEVIKDNDLLITRVKVSQQIKHTPTMYFARSPSDFNEVGFTTEIKRFTAKSLKSHMERMKKIKIFIVNVF